MSRTHAQTIRALAAEFDLYEYIWPRLCGTNRARWKQAAEFVDRAALQHHKRNCQGTMADGRTRMQVPSFVGDHAAMHRGAVTLGFVTYVDAGIPKWMKEAEHG